MPKRCALGCSNYHSYHRFPHPERNPDRFKAWVHIVGGKFDSPADYELYRKKVICDIHFTDRDRVRNNRLNFMAVPSLHLPGQSDNVGSSEQVFLAPEHINEESSLTILKQMQIDKFDKVGSSERVFLVPEPLNQESSHAILKPSLTDNSARPISSEHNYCQKKATDKYKRPQGRVFPSLWLNKLRTARRQIKTLQCNLMRTKKKNESLQMRLPSNPELRAKWLKAVGRPNWTVPSYARVCSVHFDQDQINYDGHRVRLKDDAVPLNLLPSNSNFEASDVEACRICLATDIKLYSLQGTYLATCMQALVGISRKGLGIEGLPQFVCCLCTPALVKCKKLIEQCSKSQNILLDIFNKHGEVSERLIKEQTSTQNKAKENEQSFENNYLIKIETESKLLNNDYDDEDLYFENDEDSNTYIYTQIVESKEYKMEENEDDEISDVHETEKTTVCEDTVNSSTDKDSSLNRRDDKPSTKSTQVISPGNICRRCGEEFSSFRDMMSHMKAQHPRPRLQHPWRGDKPYPLPCEICAEIMTGRKKHWLHFLRQHPKHVNTYHAVIAAVCDTCGKGFQNSTKLRVHQMRHRSPTLQCESCPRLFYDKYKLARHARVHSADKPHVCRTCGRAFKQQSNLDRHYKVHTDVASYKCTICNKAFKYSSSRNLHIRTVHQNVSHPTRKKRNKSTNDDDDDADEA
ncbi:serendipity locus protein delta isoform X1 [Helicoverpa armigera]|uniref:serendipity locus protein delta isoform X1 n=2 Tax=Helicoverpa armigera TaxID=29058 RepID=UPI00308325C8